MGRRNKSYHKDLKTQIYEKLTGMLHAGEGSSKREAIEDGTEREKIFSYSTYQSYWKHCKYFANYIHEKHPEATTLRAAKKYVNEWLQHRVDSGGKNGEPLSAWTISLERQALSKLYNITPDDDLFFKAPKRKRVDIKRSRTLAERDKHFSESNNREFVNFCKGTGCRRNILNKLEGRDLVHINELKLNIQTLQAIDPSSPEVEKELVAMMDAVAMFPDQEYFIHHRKDKGGRERYSPILGANRDAIIERMKATPPDEKVWLHVPVNADVHGYRSEYATAVYKLYARKIEEIPYDRINKGTGRRYRSQVYVCRKDESGKMLDKRAMLLASKALGHNRLEVVANNYIRGI